MFSTSSPYCIADVERWSRTFIFTTAVRCADARQACSLSPLLAQEVVHAGGRCRGNEGLRTQDGGKDQPGVSKEGEKERGGASDIDFAYDPCVCLESYTRINMWNT